MVEGFYNPAHIIRTFIANEYAFSYFFEDREIRVAHKKGVWTFAKVMKDVEASDWFSWGDNFSGVEGKNDLTRAFLSSICEHHLFDEPGRDNEAEVISHALEIWAGKSKNVLKISVLQPGRNAMVDEETLDFSLAPSANEFKA